MSWSLAGSLALLLAVVAYGVAKLRRPYSRGRLPPPLFRHRRRD